MAIETTEGGGMVITGGDVELYAVLAIKSRLHLELTVMAFRPDMNRLVKQRFGLKGNREKVYRQFCRLKGLDPACTHAGHDHGSQSTFRVKQNDEWVVIRGEGGVA
jgi:hypothetical protein